MRIGHPIPPAMRTAVGVLLSTIAAFITALVFADRPSRIFIPFLFVVVLIWLSARYGVLVSVIGSALTALIFAKFMYSPVGSFSIESPAAKANLGWMILCAICISYLLFPPSNISNRKH
jgi:integral membrane sensor domain MASE1